MPTTLLLTIGLTIVILAVAAGLTARAHRARPALVGLGLAAVVVGLYLTGLTQLAADQTLAVVDWFQRTPWTILTSWGVGLLGGGALLVLIGAFLPKGQRRPAAKAAQPAAPASSPRPQVQGGQPSQQPKPQKAPKGLDPEDAEIEELLRKRGIM